jgi:hypothetical protein
MDGGITVTEEEKTLTHLLDMCRRVEKEFTLREIVARVLDERPEMVLRFAEAWGELIRRKQIRVRREGRPSTYEVVLQEE